MGRINIDYLVEKYVNRPSNKHAVVESLPLTVFATPGKEQSVKSRTNDRLERMFKKAVNDLNQCYVIGTTAFVQKNHHRLYAQIELQEKYLDRIWNDCLQGMSKTRMFENALKRWHSLHLQSAELFKNKSFVTKLRY